MLRYPGVDPVRLIKQEEIHQVDQSESEAISLGSKMASSSSAIRQHDITAVAITTLPTQLSRLAGRAESGDSPSTTSPIEVTAASAAALLSA